MSPHALTVLELKQALERVARFASSTLGANAVRALRPAVEHAWIEGELAAVAEVASLLSGEHGWHMPAVPDVREPLRHLAKEGTVLDRDALRDVAVLITSSALVRESLQGHGGGMPHLESEAELLAELPKLARAVERAIDEDGRVRDDASPALARLRREINGARSRIVEKLQSYAASLPAQYQVADASVTVREGRYVIPVRREGRGEVGGVVHGESGTGATLFVEPPAALEMMNRLRELEGEEAREVHRILRELTGSLRPHADELAVSLESLVRIDSWYARARYAGHVGATPPRLLPAGQRGYSVVEGRHPLLVDSVDEVVPFDLQMDRSERTLLISGPNTGGKTVLLKSIGLISLLAQCGVVPPVGPGTALPVFRHVFADIGDEQSIEASLSTFSAHLKNLRETLDEADADALVLIDEIGSGTDPVEGAALAQSILLELTGRGAFTVATTHLGQLKLLATEDDSIVNASLQFDAEKLEPTYRLLKGLPGRSYGLAIARRLGLPENVLATAEQALPRGERDVARLVLELEAREQRLAEDSEELERRLGETRSLQERLQRRDAELKQSAKDAERRSRQQARDLLMRSREEVEAAIRDVRGAADQDTLDAAAHAARRRVEQAAERQRERAPEPASDEQHAIAADLEVGLRVRVDSLGTTGTIVELRDGRATVETGGLRMQVSAADLSALAPGDQQPSSETKRPRSRPAGGRIDADLEASPEVDLRGLRVEELDLQLGRALDNALVSGLPSFRIIHGKGTGALRHRVREILEQDPRISVFRPGERFEGGTGVTVVEFEG